MEQVKWKVEGMDCASCAAAITKSLQRHGMQNIKVNHISGDVNFEIKELNEIVGKAEKDIESLGYKVNVSNETDLNKENLVYKKITINKHIKNLLICLPFTLLLMSHMWFSFHWLGNPYVQLAFTIPVYIIGMNYFGVSAWKNLRKGIFHMNVLIALGASAAFVYSCIGLFSDHPHDFLFFETAASIITIVFFGNWLEHVSMERTRKQIRALTKQHKVMANMIAYDDEHNEHILPVESKNLKIGDLILIRAGEEVPIDCKILSGEVEVNEAIITGESMPVYKKQNDILIGGSVLANGNVKCYVNAIGKNTVMSSIIQLMQEAQSHKPPIQQLADKISSVFIPAVLLIAVSTIVLNMMIAHQTFGESLIRAVAVLVIACPCAMGLATPAALAIGMGRAAHNGILYTQPESMELFRTIKQIVFDKTGTLTTGKFQISNYHYEHITEEEFKKTVYSLEKRSNHPIAKSISEIWKQNDAIKWKKVEEIKGLGMKGTDLEGNVFLIGSNKIDRNIKDLIHHLYIKKNDIIIGWIDIEDEIREEAKEIINFCKRNEIKTILLSGDTYAKCNTIADFLGIDTVLAEQTPQQKLQHIEQLCALSPTAMVGDGSNDAPALAKATISISLSQASQLAIQSASVVLTSGGLKKLPTALMLGKATYNTITSNLFWAFAYNIIAIPVAAMGVLSPAIGALIMGASDVVLVLNSLWLGIKKLK